MRRSVPPCGTSVCTSRAPHRAAAAAHAGEFGGSAAELASIFHVGSRRSGAAIEVGQPEWLKGAAPGW